MKLSLFNIAQEYQQLAETIINNGGEVDEETEKALQINKENLETKAVNYGFICKELDAHNAIIDAEMDRLSSLKKSRSKTIDKLKQTLSGAMQLFGVEKIETPVMKISFRKSESVEIENIDLLESKYLTEKITHAADKTLIKSAINAGMTVTGAVLKTNQNIQIK